MIVGATSRRSPFLDSCDSEADIAYRAHGTIQSSSVCENLAPTLRSRFDEVPIAANRRTLFRAVQ